jgi:HTH-type transcriptional regulator / antitoxin HipB
MAAPVDYTVRTPQHLPPLLQAFRKQAGLTQAQAAARLGVTQQTLSALERNAAQVSVGRLLNLLGLLGVELVLRPRASPPPTSRHPAKAAW